MKKLICFILAFVMLLSFVGCTKDGGDGNTGKQNFEQNESVFDNLDFKGETITFCMSNNQDSERNGVSCAKYMTGVEDDGTFNNQDTIMVSVKNRNDYVQGKLNVKVAYTYLSEGSSYITDTVMTKYNAHDGFADLVAVMQLAIVRCMMNGIFTNVNTADKDNYFDFSNENWYKDLMQNFSLERCDVTKDKMFALLGDYFIDVIRSTDIMYINETQYDRAQGITGAVQDFYTIVSDGEWTYDTLTAMARQAFIDTGKTAGVADEDDYVGLLFNGHNGSLSTLSSLPVTFSADIDYIIDNGNGYEFNSNRNAFITLTEKAITLFHSKGVLGYGGDGTQAANDTRAVFAKGKSVFCLGLKLYDLENSMLSSMKLCAIPLPKINEEDEYRVFVHNNASVGAIFKTGNFEACSAYIQLATEKSNATRIKYYEDGLGLKYETGTNTGAMLDIIYNSITNSITEVWETYLPKAINSEYLQTHTMLINSVKNNTNSVESAWASVATINANALKEAVKRWQALE